MFTHSTLKTPRPLFFDPTRSKCGCCILQHTIDERKIDFCVKFRPSWHGNFDRCANLGVNVIFLCLYIVLQFWKDLDLFFALKLKGHRLDIFSAISVIWFNFRPSSSVLQLGFGASQLVRYNIGASFGKLGSRQDRRDILEFVPDLGSGGQLHQNPFIYRYFSFRPQKADFSVINICTLLSLQNTQETFGPKQILSFEVLQQPSRNDDQTSSAPSDLFPRYTLIRICCEILFIVGIFLKLNECYEL